MSQSICLPESLTIHQISEHFEQIKQSVADASNSLTIDAGALDNIDTSGVQMLLVLVKNLVERGIEINWQNQTGALLDSANKLGLSQELRLPQA